MGIPSGNEDGLGSGVFGRYSVYSNFFAPRIRCDYGEGQHSDTETGADTANDSVERSKFQLVD